MQSSSAFVQRWLRPLGKALALIAALHLIGGHWALLQSVAWVNMMLHFSERESLTVAIDKTFDGAHPCDLCKVVSKGRSEEQKSDPARSLLKFEAVLAGTVVIPMPVDQPWVYSLLATTPSARAFPPPTPPPLA